MEVRVCQPLFSSHVEIGSSLIPVSSNIHLSSSRTVSCVVGTCASVRQCVVGICSSVRQCVVGTCSSVRQCVVGTCASVR